MNVDGDIVDGCCNGEVLSDGVPDGVPVGDGDEVANVSNKFSTTRINRTVLMDSGVV